MKKPDKPAMTIDEIHRKYSGKVLLLQVLERDEYQLPLRAIVAASWADVPDNDQAIGKAYADATRGGGSWHLTHAGPRTRFGPEHEAAVRELVAQIKEVVGGPRASGP